jgi:hypothetical protein
VRPISDLDVLNEKSRTVTGNQIPDLPAHSLVTIAAELSGPQTTKHLGNSWCWHGGANSH